MISVKVNKSDPTDLYVQVAAEIRRAIAEGEAKPGERLPPAKDLAAILGVNTNTVGLFLPATPSVGQKLRSEDVPAITREEDEVISVSESITVPTGSYTNCVKVKEILSDGAVEYKLYAPGVGIVKEISEDGAIELQSHS